MNEKTLRPLRPCVKKHNEMDMDNKRSLTQRTQRKEADKSGFTFKSIKSIDALY